MIPEIRWTWNPSPLARRVSALRRRANRYLVELEFRARRTRVRGRPYVLFVDPVNQCNLRCPLCPTGLRMKGRPKGRMSREVYDRVLTELAPHAIQILLYNWGEPLLHPDIFAFVRAAHERGLRTMLSSNLNLLEEEQARDMVRSGLDNLILSLDGTRPETYAFYRVGGDFEKVKENARLLARVKREMGSPRPHVTLQFLVFRHNYGDIPGIEALAREIGVDDVSVMNGYLGGEGQTPYVGRSDSRALAEKWLVRDSGYAAEFDYFADSEYLSPKRCYFPWKTVTINWDGAVSPCCCVFDASTDFGTIMDQPFLRTWNNEKYRAARALFGRQRPSGGAPTICHACKLFQQAPPR